MSIYIEALKIAKGIKMEELIQKAKNGDRKAFTEIFFMYKENLFKLAITKTKNEQDAEDLVQETMMEAYLSIHKLKKNKAFKKWIVKILLNKCKNFYRKKGGKVISLDNSILQNIRVIDVDVIEKLESGLDFNLLINKLNDKEKEVALLYYNEKYTTKEISKILSINENTIKSMLKRIKSKIKVQKKEEVKNG